MNKYSKSVPNFNYDKNNYKRFVIIKLYPLNEISTFGF